MRGLAILVGSFVLILAGSALLAPWLFWLAQAFAALLPDKAVLGPFHQYLTRGMLVCGLLALFIMRYLAFSSWQQLGLRPPQQHWRQFVAGFFWTFVLLSLFATIAVIAGGRALNADVTAAKLMGRLATALTTALVVAFLEELLFRGALFGGLCRTWSMPAALLVSSMIYAIVHFPQRTQVLTEVSWYTGFVMLPEMLRGFIDIQQMMPGFLFLAAAGIIFGLAYHWTGALYSSMGLHAGAIVVIKLYGSMTRPIDVDSSFWGSGKLTDGWLPLLYILVLLVAFPRLPLGQSSRPAVFGVAADPALARTDHRKA